jgi:DNA-binding HxlR family transcriptional regulator
MEMSFRSGCPIASALDIFGDKWSLVIVRSIAMGASRYADLARAPEGIATNILADRLKRLEGAGIVRREAGRRYALTESGGALVPVIQAISRWGEARLPGRWTPPPRFHALRPADFR